MKKTIVLLDWEPEIAWFKFSNLYFGVNAPQVFNKYFNIEIYDKNKNYDVKQCVFVILDCYNQDKFLRKLPEYKSIESNGYKVIVWLFAEYPGFHHYDLYKNFPIFYVPHWFWFPEVSRYVDGYHSFYRGNGLVFNPAPYPRVGNRNKLAFMPIGKFKPWRQDLLKKVARLLPDMVYSNMSQGVYLPRNVDYEHSFNLHEMKGRVNDRYFNPQWYNDTYFSLVSETFIIKTEFKYNKNNEDAPLFLTEKTFKPIMFRHPFMIWGQVGVLAYLKELGFETFENLFDESYDTIENNDDRLNIIAGNLNNLRKQLYNTKHKNLSIYQYDKITEEKIEHNYRLFFNGSVVESRLVNDLIHPFLEMCE